MNVKKMFVFWLLICYSFIWVFDTDKTLVNASSGATALSLTYVDDGVARYDITGADYSRLDALAVVQWQRDTNAPLNNLIDRGWIQFNISTIPPTATITRIELRYDGNQYKAAGDIGILNYTDPNGLGAQDLYNYCGNGTILVNANASFPNVADNSVITLADNTTAPIIVEIQRLQSLGYDNFTLFFKMDNEAVDTNGGSQIDVVGAIPDPTLYIEYYIDPKIYVFTGEYYENGTFVGAETVTVSSTGTSEDITVDGTSTEYYSTRPTLVTWLFGTTTRRYYIVSDTENITITEPDDTYSTYSFEFRDYAGLVGISDSYLEALRTINGTETIVERNIIYNTDTTTPLTLVQNRVYRLRIRLPDGTYYNLGYFTPGSTDPPTFSLTGLGFNDQYQPTSRWITQTSDRVNDTAIQYNYTSTVPGYSTLNVTVSLCYRNGTIIYTNSSVAETVSFTWNNLVNTTTYKVNSTITHEYYGILDDYSHLISGAFIPETFLSLDGLGISTDLLGAFLLICSAGITSRKFRAVGVAIMATYALVINYWGWLTVPYWLIGLVYAISGLMFLRGG
jgi:hypothetical protein